MRLSPYSQVMATESSACVLVADDDPDLADILAYQIRLSGFETLIVTDLDEGVSAIEAGAVQMVMTDLRFGHDTCERIVQAGRDSGLPVLIITGSPETARDVFPDHPDHAVLGKPVSMDELTRALGAVR